jgi:hypothetical protein
MFNAVLKLLGVSGVGLFRINNFVFVVIRILNSTLELDYSLLVPVDHGAKKFIRKRDCLLTCWINVSKLPLGSNRQICNRNIMFVQEPSHVSEYRSNVLVTAFSINEEFLQRLHH